MIEALLESGLAEYGLTDRVSPQAAELLDQYARELLEKNQVMNLTAIREAEGVARLHMLDCAALAKICGLEGKTLLDVGTGAGFPGMVLKILAPSLGVTLLDSLQKRLNFLEALCGELGLSARLLHARAEDAGRAQDTRERYDAATSRAVASMALLAEYCLPLLRVGGVLLCLKGSGGQEEAREGAAAIQACGGALREVKEYALPGGDRRTLLVVEKVSPTPKKYPRTPAQLAKAGKAGRSSGAGA